MKSELLLESIVTVRDALNEIDVAVTSDNNDIVIASRKN